MEMPESTATGLEAVGIIDDNNIASPFEEDDELVDDDEDYDQETSAVEAVDADPTSKSSVLQAVGLGRVFRVSNILRALTGHRPSILMAGHLEEIVQQPDGSVVLERVAIRKMAEQQSKSSTEAGMGEFDGLQISLRFEPPSAKFKASRGVSFRLSVIEAGHSLLSCRGLPTILSIQTGALAVAWGPLQIVFETGDQMDAFFAVVSKYVEIEPAALWPPHVIALWVHARASMSGASWQSSTADERLGQMVDERLGRGEFSSLPKAELASTAAVAAAQPGPSARANQQEQSRSSSTYPSACPMAAFSSLAGIARRYPVASVALAACSAVALAFVVARVRR